jgi:hypothetical protein
MASWSMAKPKTKSSMACVVTPGRTNLVSASRHVAASRPAARMPAKPDSS